MKKVLLTGATGFIGRHCLPILLRHRYEVHAVFLRKLLENQAKIHWHQVDLLNFGDISRLIAEVQPSHLLHLAWFVEPGQYWNSEKNLLWVQASVELLREFREQGGQRAVMAGTCAEYDWNYGFCSEFITPKTPHSLYGICKKSLQEMLCAYSEITGLSSAWGRIFFLYGPHEHPNRFVSSVILSLLDGKPARCSHGNQLRDFLYVQDVADAFVALLESEVVGEVNIASGQPIKIKTIVMAIADTLDCSHLIRWDVIPVAATEPPVLIADVRRLSQEVDWNPQYDLQIGLKQTIEWWQSRYARTLYQ